MARVGHWVRYICGRGVQAGPVVRTEIRPGRMLQAPGTYLILQWPDGEVFVIHERGVLTCCACGHDEVEQDQDGRWICVACQAPTIGKTEI